MQDLKFYRAILNSYIHFYHVNIFKGSNLSFFGFADGLNRQNCKEYQWVNGVAVSHLLCMQKAPGSNPGLSIFDAKV